MKKKIIISLFVFIAAIVLTPFLVESYQSSYRLSKNDIELSGTVITEDEDLKLLFRLKDKTVKTLYYKTTRISDRKVEIELSPYPHDETPWRVVKPNQDGEYMIIAGELHRGVFFEAILAGINTGGVKML